ncbi:phosphoribosyl-AMP cyclohydrolase [Candidatus Vidania fulgoroideae]|uniref:phosphoribosyl-AMP cyclohydrolase n=1 Tax=Candidatus Vidania fulgoroideorum TaxID=881286 RepID=A0A974X9Y8_9PROT|nr:phosphoribosyl-AMP cyclohydrolase [Candidatus Vidania fulgoroideae]
MNKLTPVIVTTTTQILMLAWTTKDLIKNTIKYGYTYFFSRKHNKIWIKGEKSSNFQLINKVLIDCDQDTYIYVVTQINNISCHTGSKSCFTEINDNKHL